MCKPYISLGMLWCAGAVLHTIRAAATNHGELGIDLCALTLVSFPAWLRTQLTKMFSHFRT